MHCSFPNNLTFRQIRTFADKKSGVCRQSKSCLLLAITGVYTFYHGLSTLFLLFLQFFNIFPADHAIKASVYQEKTKRPTKGYISAFSLPERNAKKKLRERHYSSKISAAGKFQRGNFRRLRAATRAVRPLNLTAFKKAGKTFGFNVCRAGLHQNFRF